MLDPRYNGQASVCEFVGEERWKLFTNMASNVSYLCLSSEQLFGFVDY